MSTTPPQHDDGDALAWRPEGESYEGQGLRFLVRAVHRAFTRRVEEELSSHTPITYAQWSFLRALWLKDGLSQRELSDHVGLKENTTVVALGLMEKRGWVRREPDPRDRRRMRVFLTPAGRELERLRAVVRQVNRDAVRGVPREMQDAIREGLSRMLHNLDRPEDTDCT